MGNPFFNSIHCIFKKHLAQKTKLDILQNLKKSQYRVKISFS
ncbi:hypothetical protein LEP1GSC021_0651 [Leptospira noguchii str. 1993005606]|uniref:Uncharacterized protein n=1 Tax=Leptospira noguchii str. 2007001578 TaxID=1049974 RepID=A0ABN0IXR2_9LEPT|nr:hypothetical protein LEP1GSC035_1245 [Leptospira noguchii str. 2007001578]EPE82419.1 hypothetical protein LEP1GSC021_0651 [Leptospira noguchii str. 1993005606]